MKILVACEESQAVTKELRRLGHEAYSCDLLECSGGHPEWHIQGDVLPLLNGSGSEEEYFCTQDNKSHLLPKRWDMIIAFPPCTHLAVSGAAHFAKKAADGRQQQGIDFFMAFANADCDRIAIENPVGIMSSKWRKPDQIIQPWWFGDNVGKSTCLWLKGLPLLKQEVMDRPPVEYHTWTSKDGRQKRQEKWFYETRCLPHSERGKVASKTFPGVARAMAEQWAGPSEKFYFDLVDRLRSTVSVSKRKMLDEAADAIEHLLEEVNA